MSVTMKKAGSSRPQHVIVAMGGSVTDWPDCCKYPQSRLYDPSCHVLLDDVWVPLPPMPTPILEHTRHATYMDGSIYVTGMWNEQGRPDRRASAASLQQYADDSRKFYRLDISRKAWEVLDAASLTSNPDLKYKLMWGPPEDLRSDYGGAPCFCIQDKAYTVTDGWHNPLKLHTFDIQSQQWTSVEQEELYEVTKNRSVDYALTEMGGKLFLIGGRNVKCQEERAIIAYDPLEQTWESFAPLPQRCLQGYGTDKGPLSAVGHNGGLFISGGGVPPVMLTSEGNWITQPPIPRGERYYDNTELQQHPINDEDGEPCGCFDSEDEEEPTTEEWKDHIYHNGWMADHVLVSVEWV